MNALARRLAKLEAIVADPTGERQRRVAAGLCPDGGYAHGYLPTNGGLWRCVVCGNRFVLRPGPACLQECSPGTGRGCRALQRPRSLGIDTGHTAEQVAWFAERRAQRAVDDLHDSMLPEHVDVVQGWMKAHFGDAPIAQPGASWYSILDRWKPPALVRAVWLLINHHIATRLSVSLAPRIAATYLNDQDAWPVRPCSSCRYPLPGRARLGPDSKYEHLGEIHVEACPICSLVADGER